MITRYQLAVLAAAGLGSCGIRPSRPSVAGSWVARISGNETCPPCSSVQGMVLIENDAGNVSGIAASFTQSGYDIASGAGYVTGLHIQDSLVLSATGQCQDKLAPQSSAGLRATISRNGNELVGSLFSTTPMFADTLPAVWRRAPLDSVLLEEVTGFTARCPPRS